ncbi:MAG: cytochrome c biogenesis protein CcsA [Acidobacteriia bacterium]|nr:cytochrome c biogenesis protein CcsA [Terriglobia bacterium]
MREKLLYGAGLAAFLLLARNILVIADLPGEAAQGAIFKIIFFHVPAAWTAMVAATAALTLSILFLKTKDFRYDAAAVAVTEVGLAFLAANLVTGSIWGRVIWGIWWTWDVRLTSALVCWLLYAGYLMLRHAIEEPTQRATFAAVFSIFAFIDVPIVIFSIRWFRTQHPGPVFLSSTGSFPHDWTMVLLWNWVALMLLASILGAIRLGQEETQREIDYVRRMAHAL